MKSFLTEKPSNVESLLSIEDTEQALSIGEDYESD